MTTPQWPHDAACAGRTDIEWIPTGGESPDAKALQLCRICLVRVACIKFALKNPVAGYWGGTTRSQRDRMKSVRPRAKCPVCQGTPVAEIEDGSQACVGCGHSWRAVRNDPEPVTEEGSPKKTVPKGDKPVVDVPIVLAGVLSEGRGA